MLHLTVSLLYVLGLGSLFFEVLAWAPAHTSRLVEVCPTTIPPAVVARALSARLGMGVLVHVLAVTAGPPLRHVLPAGVVCAIPGLILLGRRIIQGWTKVSLAAAAWIGLGLIITMGASYVLLMDAISAHDARSIWFFQAKILYYAGSLRPDAGWLEPAIAFAHPDYPKLVPILAASEMLRFGYWNEFLPKLALVPLLACLVFALLAGPRGLASVGALGMTLMALLAGGSLVHNGYADIYAALPAAGALMAALRWLRRGDHKDAEHVFVLLGLALSTKEEGRIFAVALIAGMSPFLGSSRVRAFCKELVHRPASLAVLALALAPALLWGVRAHCWGLRGYLRLDHAAIERAATRIHDGALGFIVDSLLAPQSKLFDAGTVAFLGLLAVTGVIKVLSVLLTRRLQLPSVVCLLTGFLYFAALCLVYLTTPFPYAGHVGSSADRVMLVPFMCVLVFLADALEDVECLVPCGVRKFIAR